MSAAIATPALHLDAKLQQLEPSTATMLESRACCSCGVIQDREVMGECKVWAVHVHAAYVRVPG